ncbi:MAG: small multi-drug export protein [Eubacteriales bacterium]|nr:small multi-drug export protein [Eubacteriales bacterium]
MISWLTSTTLGKFIATFFISMVPVIELRGGLPYGIGFGLDYPLALTAAIMGNMLPVPFIIAYISRIFIWLRGKHKKLDDFVTKMERRAHLKGQKVEKYGPLMLLIFVGIPLPGTGAWTGALIAALLNMRMKQALPCIFLGVLMAAAIITALTFGVIHII